MSSMTNEVLNAIVDPEIVQCNSGDCYDAGNLGGHGEEFQRNMAILLFERATLLKYNFKLAFEISDAEKFDDIGIYLEKTNEWLLIQAKHTDLNAFVTQKDLFPTTEKSQNVGNFSIYKYLQSYVNVQHFWPHGGCPKFYLFTNRGLERRNEHLYRERAVNEILCFPDSKHFELKPNPHVIEKLKNYVNRESIELLDAVEKLFKDGKVDAILLNYKTPLRQILVKSGKSVMFSDKLNGSHEDKTVQKLFDKINSLGFLGKCISATTEMNVLWMGESPRKKLPPFYDDKDIDLFFENFTLSVNQPNVTELHTIINNDLSLWIKSWMFPDDYMKLSIDHLSQPLMKFKKCLGDYETKKKSRKFLKLSNGENVLQNVKEQLLMDIHKMCRRSCTSLSEIFKYYIHRRITYTVEEDASESTDFMIDSVHLSRFNDDDQKKFHNNVSHNSLELNYRKNINKNSTHFRKQKNQKMITDTKLVENLLELLQNEKCILLTAKPGMGKSTLLQFVAFESQKKYHDINIVLLYLNNLASKFKKTTKVQNSSDVLDILSGFLSIDNIALLRKYSTCNNEKTPNSEKNENVKFIIFLDAIDELVPNHTEKVLKLIEILCSIHAVKLFITSRSNLQNLLEHQLKIKSMSLESFNNEDNITFLRKYWDHSFNCTKYSEQILKDFYTNKNKGFVDLPLVMKMVAETSTDTLHILMQDKSASKDFVLRQSLSLVSVYENFIEKCLRQNIGKKIDKNTDDFEFDDMFEVWIEEMDKNHQLLAIENFIPATMLNKIKTNYDERFNKFLKNISNGKEKSLLIDVVDGIPQFTHLSYGEFFVAKYLYKHINSWEHSENQIIFHILEQQEVVRSFFFAMIETEPSQKHAKIIDACGDLAFIWACEEDCVNLIEYLYSLRGCNNICKSDGQTMLHIASLKGHTDLVEKLIAKNTNVNFTSKNQNTALHLAAQKGHSKIVKYLIDNAAMVEAANCYRQTPLHFASLNGHIDVVKQLIAKGSNVNAVTKKKLTPLHLAAQKGHCEVLNYLIDNFALVEAKDCDGWTVLHTAVMNGHVDVVKQLIAKSYNVNAVTNKQNTPLHFAAQKGHIEIVNNLIQHFALVEVLNGFGQTPLHFAALNGHIDVVKQLIAKGSNVNAVTKKQFTPLHLAAQKGQCEIVNYLMDNFALVEAKDCNGWTVLHTAVFYGHVDVVKQLIAKSSNVNAVTKKQNTPLHLAAQKGHCEIVSSLINNLALIEAKDCDGMTVLSTAVFYGNTDVVKLLIAKKANVNTVTKKQNTPLNVAAQKGHIEIVNILIDNLALVDADNYLGFTPLHTATINGHIDVVKQLIAKSSNVNAVTKKQSTPLHLAAQKGHCEIVNYLIDNFALVETKDFNEWTVLHDAVFYGHVDVVKQLIAKSSNVNAVTKKQNTPLHLAAQKGHIFILNYLIEHLALVEALNCFGQTPLHLAAQNGHFEIVNCLINNSALIEAKDCDGMTVLSTAALYGNTDVVKLLIAKKVNVNTVTNNKNTALNVAAQKGHIEIVSILIENLALVDADNCLGQTPLHTATINGHIDVVRKLILNNANVNAVTKNQNTPLHLAAQKGHSHIVNYLIDNSAAVEAKNCSGQTPLHYAAVNGHIDVVKLLTVKNTNVNAVAEK